MNPRIAIISTYSMQTEIIQDIISNLNKNVYVAEGALEEGARLCVEFERQGFEAVITGKVTAIMARRRVNIPVIDIENSAYDILETLYRASNITKHIAYIGPADDEKKYDFVAMSKILQCKITPLFFTNLINIDQVFMTAQKMKAEVIVGSGACIADVAEKFGLKCLVVTTREGVTNALRLVEQVVAVKRMEKEENRRLLAIMNSISDGIFAINGSGKITACNEQALRFLGAIEKTNVVGRSPKDIIPSKTFNQVFSDIKQGDKKIVKIGNRLIIISLICNHLDKEIDGSLFLLQDAKNIQETENDVRRRLASRGLVAKYSLNDIIGHSPAIQNTVLSARNFSKTDATILITGESGTGKELFAQGIHSESNRKNGPFVAINCISLPESLLESELFGYDEGAFTGAKSGGKKGVFELAHGGTIFLDEIGEITKSLQARLLRVLQEKEIMRVGGDRVIPVDVRIIAATNRNLQQAVKNGLFREDLYYRLNVLTLHLPPLRNRKEDLPLLFEYFYQQFCWKYKREYKEIPGSVLEQLKIYEWPGNVRELENFAERYVILSEQETNTFALLNQMFNEQIQMNTYSINSDKNYICNGSDGIISLKPSTLEEMELQIIKQMESLVGSDRTRLANSLGISKVTLWKKLKKIQG